MALLDGVTVLDLSTVGPAARASRWLADYGARVVKVGAPEGLQIEPPLGSIYVWVPVPSGQTSQGFAEELLDRVGVVVAPGTGYGAHGEGFVRVSLTVGDDRLAEAMRRIRAVLGAGDPVRA